MNYRRNLRPASTFFARGSFFIFGFILTFSWYIFSRAKLDYISEKSNEALPVNYLGVIGWCFMLGWFLIPPSRLFRYSGRSFVL
mmetsp:Transcript_21119/g.3432  ORF Transcript_21119/g.3432 Transcript_21119/m.3432 type:complete len:84 (-) Transcript_21119:829-1080(-)